MLSDALTTRSYSSGFVLPGTDAVMNHRCRSVSKLAPVTVSGISIVPLRSLAAQPVVVSGAMASMVSASPGVSIVGIEMIGRMMTVSVSTFAGVHSPGSSAKLTVVVWATVIDPFACFGR